MSVTLSTFSNIGNPVLARFAFSIFDNISITYSTLYV